jgi:hypothetical protein
MNAATTTATATDIQAAISIIKFIPFIPQNRKFRRFRLGNMGSGGTWLFLEDPILLKNREND